MKKLVFNVKAGSGLPGKSFIHIIDVDVYLRTLLSYLVHTPFFDAYVASKIQRHHRYKDREKTTAAFINYLCVYDERRIKYILPSKFLPRSSLIALLTELQTTAHRYEEIISKESPSMEELSDVVSLRFRWGSNIDAFIKTVYSCADGIKTVQDGIANHYLRFIVRQLLLNRRGDSDPDHLRTDAWFAISDMIDAYDPCRSKVPFNNILSFYTKNRKNKVIHDETWGLKQGDIIHLGSLDDDDEEGVGISSAQLQKEVENGLHASSVSSERYALIDVLSESLLKPFVTIVQLQFGILEPFSVEEEVRMLMANTETCKTTGGHHGSGSEKR